MRCFAKTAWVVAGRKCRLDCVLDHGHEGIHETAELVEVSER